MIEILRKCYPPEKFKKNLQKFLRIFNLFLKLEKVTKFQLDC